MTLRARLRRWVGPDEAPAVATENTPAPGAEWAAQLERFRAAIDSIRKNASVSAKALAALGSAALSSLAIEKFGDIFPLDADNRWAVAAAVAAVLSFLAVAFALAWFTVRLWRVDAPVAMSASKQRVREDAEKFDKEAAKKALRRFDETARFNAAPSLEAYAARASRFERIARRLPDSDARRGELLEQATAIRHEVHATMAHVAVDVVRNRSRSIVNGAGTVCASILFVGGLCGIAVAADYLDGERTGRLSVAKECAAAAKALGEQVTVKRGVPPICGSVIEGGVGAKQDELVIARANACAAAVKALKDEGLSTAELTGAKGPCAVAAPDPPTTKADAVSAVVPALLEQAAQCEQAAGTGDCAEIYALIEAARRGGNP